MFAGPLLAVMLTIGAPPAADTLVVCPTPWRAALAPWIEYREAQGHHLALVAGEGSAEKLRGAIRNLARGGGVEHLVLVGDAASPTVRGPTPGVATHFASARVTRRWGGEPEIATDNWYADLDDDGAPDLAVGRLSVSTPGELVRLIDKTIAYERNNTPGAWRRRIDLVASVGGFGNVADTAIEQSARTLLTGCLPAAYETHVTYGSCASPFCPDPRLFRETLVGRWREGCLFWIYLGHGQAHAVDRLHLFDGSHPILETADVPRLRSAGAPPVAIFLACYAGAYDAAGGCLGEELLRAEAGSVAVLAGSRLTMPYGMACLGYELMEAAFAERQPTLGRVLRSAKRRATLAPRDEGQRQTLDTVARLIHPGANDLAAERHEHVQLFNLLGDPLLRVRQPAQATMEAPRTARAGTTIEIRGQSPVAGEAQVELVVAPGRLTFRFAPRAEYDGAASTRARYQREYVLANDARLSTTTARVDGGAFTARLEIPATARGACAVRLLVSGADDAAIGSTAIEIERP
jgi:Peptidase family C25